MSSAPTPPPYDSKGQWRAYRAQQKAAWRAQRDTWKAQQHAWKASYMGAYGPYVPSLVGPVILIGVGVVALLIATGRFNAGVFWAWYGSWWPLLLIGAGVAMLGEWALDLLRPTPVRRGGGFIGLIILLGIVGVTAAGWNHVRPWFAQMENQNEWGFNQDFAGIFGLPEHDFDEPAQNARIPANAAVEIVDPRGDVSVTVGDVSAIQVQARAVAYANSDKAAQTIFAAEAARVVVNGTAVEVSSAGDSRGRLNLIVTVPRSASVTVKAGKGDVTATGLNADVHVTAQGNIRLDSIRGPVEARFSGGNYDFSAHDVQGGLIIDGNMNDLTLAEIKGAVKQNGEVLGNVSLGSINGPVHLHTSVTDLQLGRLPGDLIIDSDDLHVNEADGPVRVVTHSKDVDLSQIYGDSTVEDRDGSISVEPAGAYGVDARNSEGGVELTLPPNASADVNARAHNGDIVSDYPIPPLAGADKAVTFQIGSGTARIVLSADNGDIHIKKGPAFPPESNGFSPASPAQARHSMLNVPSYHRVPSLYSAPRLKAQTPLPAQPVSQ